MTTLNTTKEELWKPILRNAGLPTNVDQAYRGALPTSLKGRNVIRDIQRAAMFLRAYLLYEPDAMRYCEAHNIGFVRAATGERTQTASDNTLGGVFVIAEIEKAILDLRVQYGVFRRNASVKPMQSEQKTIHKRKGGLKAYPQIPGKYGIASKALYGDIDLFARKWTVLTKCESELLEDAQTFLDELITEMAYAFTFTEDDAGFNGDGSDKYNGVVGVITKLVNVADNPASVKGLQIASGNSWEEITRADVLGLVSKLPAFARREGSVKWYCSHEFWAKVLLPIEMDAGSVSYTEEGGESKPLFIGKPVEFVEVMPSEEANNQIPLLYGNLAQAAVFGDRRGVTIKRTDASATEFETDIESIKASARFDIVVHSVGDEENAGAIVGLMTASS
jgi:HK97 family phage major capsid protein